MITSTHDLVVRHMSHIPHPTTALQMKTSHLLMYILVLLAFVHSAPCNVPHPLKHLLSVRSSTTMVMRGQLCTCLVQRRCSVFLVALQLGSGFWLASCPPN